MNDSPQQSSEPSRWARPVVPALVVAALAIAALIVVVVVDDDHETDVATTTTTAPSTTAGSTTSTSSGTTTTTSQPATTAPGTSTATEPAVWPPASGAERFDEPVELARRFSTDFVGFTDPSVGPFRQGDGRSGEVEVRPRTDGPVTTVLVRQLDTDATWWVIGTATANIEVDAPSTMTTVARPLTLRGRALAFEGTVDVEVRADGVVAPIATGFVTGRGDGQLGPFESTLEYPTPPSTLGTVLFLTHSAEDGQVWEAAVVRIRFPAP